MIRKMKLDVDALAVETFTLHDGPAAGGTVLAHDSEDVALIPTTDWKSCRCTTRAPIRYSIAMCSVKDLACPPNRSWRKATFMVCGDLVASTLSCSRAQSLSAAFSASTIASTASRCRRLSGRTTALSCCPSCRAC